MSRTKLLQQDKLLHNRAALQIRRDKYAAKRKYIIHNWQLYLFLLPALITLVLFKYVPMYGVQIAFRDFDAYAGISGSEWVGFKHFSRFFESYYFGDLLWNTIAISVYQLVLGFIIPIVLALLLTQLESARFKKLVQNVIFAPRFISVVVIVGMLTIFLSPSSGLVNKVFELFGKDAIDFMAQPQYFRNLYVWSGVWQSAGWGTVIYIAALSSVNPELYEAAVMDGANKFQRMLYIDIPSILPTMIMVLILNTGSVMNIGFEKIFLMQNGLNLPVSEVISTYVYKVGMLNTDYSFSAAIGLFNSLINCVLLFSVNTISKKVGDTGLW